jgi:hypothetical protein
MSRSSRRRNLAAFLKRLESDEIPGARLRATFGGNSVERLECLVPQNVPVSSPAAWERTIV